MGWRAEEYLDTILVPTGFIIFLGYHLVLLYRALILSQMTHLDSLLHLRRLSVHHILRMEVANEHKERYIAEMSNNVTMANTYGSYSLTLVTIIVSLLTVSSTFKPITYGERSPAMGTLKSVCIFIFTLVAFLCSRMAAKILLYACLITNVSRQGWTVQTEYVVKVVVRGLILFEVGSRSFYFSLALAAWFIGPIPMFIACLMLLAGLYKKDTHKIPLVEDPTLPE